MFPSIQRSGSRRIPVTSADGYFRYIVESVVNADFTEAKRKRQDVKNRCCILLVIRISYTEKLPGSISELFHIICFGSNSGVD